ncbi:cysteine hydrolase [Pusillimonas sp.]|uniref:cysteine hydrolase n=1 Tax=Pusillimonas sp. TaxID=3040095 RepID=UPI0029ACC5F1|nr:cysteine hydrolase [Pusillimonas sp.]MDX3893925.1 cysteine hydrolase [Pusillimonas sp.]
MTTSQLMPSHVIERVMQKRGRMRIFDRFEPSRTALVVIDMQRFYVEGLPPATRIIPVVNRLAQGFRAKGASVAWVSMTAGEGGESLWPLYHDYFFSADNGARHRDGLTPGNPGHQLHPDLDVRAGDIRASKTRFSAFFPGVCDLHEQLAARGIENVAIGGVVTNFCCETSARDAMMLDYKVAMVSDANAARYPEDHQAGFTTVFQSFGDVLTSDEMLDEVLR